MDFLYIFQYLLGEVAISFLALSLSNVMQMEEEREREGKGVQACPFVPVQI